jgi:uncharacterized membrane protein
MKTRKLVSKSFFRLKRLLRQMWVRTSAFALLALFAAFLSRVFGPYLPQSLVEGIQIDAVLDILTVLSSSMLAVTTFSLGVIMSTRHAISSGITPRAHKFVSEDPVTQRVLATFMGAFVYALTAQVLLRTGYYQQAASAVILLVTIAVLVLVVIAMLGWIEHLTRVGSIPDTVAELEAAMKDAFEDWKNRPALGACPTPHDAPLPAAASRSVTAARSGYVQHIDIGRLNALAEGEGAAQIYVNAPVGAYVVEGDVICRHSGDLDHDELLRAFTIDHARTYEQDVRFGVIVLSEIAQRALSPAVNDPGTAIYIVDRITGLLVNGGRPADEESPTCPHVFLPAVTSDDLVADGFNPIARDGAAMVEVQSRLQKAFAALVRQGDAEMAEAAQKASERAAQLAEAALVLEEDRARIRQLSNAVQRAEGIAATSPV